MDWRAATQQGQLWGRAAHDWAELQEPLGAPLWEAMLDAAAVGLGSRVLDAGCGAGGASVLAAGRGAQVNGLDAAEALLAIARERVPDGDFRLGGLEALPYGNETFDAVIASNVLPYVAHPRAALSELRRVCAAHGRLVVAVWGRPEDCPQHVVATAIRALLPRPVDEELPLGDALSAPGLLDTLVTQAGLRVLGGGTVSCPFAYPDEEMLWQAQASAGPVQAALRLIGAEPLKAALLRAVVPYQAGTGAVRLPHYFHYVAATPLDDGPARS